MSINHCKGCQIALPFLVKCYLHSYNDKGQCPCSNCIVKPMCKIECDDFKLFEIGILDCNVIPLNYLKL